jgi:hypothetical protein
VRSVRDGGLMLFLVRMRCQRHGGARVWVETDEGHLEQDFDTRDYVLHTITAWCEGRESGPDPVEDPDSWTISWSKKADTMEGYTSDTN